MNVRNFVYSVLNAWIPYNSLSTHTFLFLAAHPQERGTQNALLWQVQGGRSHPVSMPSESVEWNHRERKNI